MRLWQDSCCYYLFADVVLVLIWVEVWILFVCWEYDQYCCRITMYEIKFESYLGGIYLVICSGKLSEYSNDQALVSIIQLIHLSSPPTSI